MTDKRATSSGSRLKRQVEEAKAEIAVLAAERQQFRDLFDAAPIGYIVTDHDGTICEVNRAAAQMLGVSASHLRDKPLDAFIPPEHRDAFLHFLHTAVSASFVRRWETHYQPLDKPLRDVELTVAPIELAGRQPAGGLRWLLRDITEQKHAETAKLDHFFHETFERSPVGIGHLSADGRWLRVNQALCDTLGYTRDELLAAHMQQIAYSEDAARFHEAHDQIVGGVLPIVGLELRCLSKKGEIVWARLGISSVSDAHGHHAYGIAIFSDITESKRIAAAERKQRRLTEALRDTSLTLNSTLDFEEVLDQIMMVIGGIFSQKAATIMLAESDQFCVARAWGYAEMAVSPLEKAVASLRTPAVPEGIFKHMTGTLKPVIVNNWSDHGEWEPVPEIRAIRSLIAVPIISFDDLIGSLLLYSPRPDAFTAQEGEMLETFAAYAAVAIRNARAHQQARLLAADEERHRLARDLHDAVTQSLFSASIISESLTRRQKNKEDPLAGQLQELHLLTRGALAEMRTLLMELRPEFLLKSPLSVQIRQLGDALRSRKRMNIEFVFEGEGVLPAETHIAFYRIAQEIFNNIVKHSQAANVRVRLDTSPDAILLDIRDDGVGFDPVTVTTGIGMATMRERADALRASLVLNSVPGGGTHVIVKWHAETRR